MKKRSGVPAAKGASRDEKAMSRVKQRRPPFFISVIETLK